MNRNSALPFTPLAVTRATLIAVLSLAPGLAAAWQIPGGTAVCDTTGNQTEPLVIADGAGGAIIGWNDTRSSDDDIYAERLRPDGIHEWTSNGVVVCSAPNTQLLEDVVTDGMGGAIFVWTDRRNDGSGDLWAQRLRSDGTAAWANHGVPVSLDAGTSQSGSVITSDGVGGCIIAWVDDRSQNNHVYAQRLDASGNRLWDTTGVALCSANDNQDNLAIIGDAVGGAIVSWIDRRSGAPKVYVQKVDPNGASLWILDGVQVCAESVDERPTRVVSDGAGGAIVVWTDPRSGILRVYARRVDANGTPMWATNGVQLGGATQQQDPTAVTDGLGGAIVAWIDSSDVFAQRVDPSGALQWGLNGLPVCDQGSQQLEPVAAPDGTSGAVICWRDARSGLFLYAQRLDAAGSELWANNGVPVCDDPASPYDASIVPDGSGGAIVVWEDDRGPTNVYAERVGHDGTVGPGETSAWIPDGTPVTTRAGVQQNPSAVPDGEGGALIAWEDYGPPSPEPQTSPEGLSRPLALLGPGHARIRTGRLTDAGDAAGSWSPGGDQVTDVPSDQVEPASVSDGKTGIIVVWKDNRNSQFDVYAQRLLGDATIASGWGTDGQPVCVAGGAQERPVAVSDGAGGAIVCWEDRRTGTDFDIYAVRITASGSLAPGWIEDGIPICTAVGNQSTPVMTSDGRGGAFIAWSDSRANPSRIYMQHVTAGGVTLLSANGIPATNFIAQQVEPAIAADGVGGVFVVWTDSRLDSGDIYGQHVNTNGSRTWTLAGHALTNAAGKQSLPAIVSSGASTVILVWEDQRALGTTGVDLYATSRTIDLGVPSGWIANGNPVCTAAVNQLSPQLVADGAGGVFATWVDARTGGNDIWAMQINSAGGPAQGWPVNGFPISTAGGSQEHPRLVTDGSGGAIVAWTDGRVADPDIYAMHLFGPATRSPTDVSEAAPGPVRLTLTPNPARQRVAIGFELAKAEAADVEVLDVAGRRVTALSRGVTMAAGRRNLFWECRDDLGGAARSGLYFVRVRAGGVDAVRRLVLIR